jgi:hypothetical protein
MNPNRALSGLILLALALPAIGPTARAQQPPAAPASVKTVEIAPATIEAEVGQQIKFTAVGKDSTGKPTDQKPAAWFAAPFDLAAADETGTVTIYGPGEVRVGAFIGGKIGYATILVKPARVARIDIARPEAPIAVGGAIKLSATARTANGDPRADAMIVWTSEAPAVARVDAAGVVTGLASGKATLRASCEGASSAITVDVARHPIQHLTIEPRSTKARTGEVIRFAAQARDKTGAGLKTLSVYWAVSGEGAMVEADGGFVAERPGTYIVTATSGDRVAVASVVVTPRHVEREIEIVGRAPMKEFQAAEQWIIGNYVYVSSIADRIWVYDISDPAQPKLTDTLIVDARIVNDVSTTADGKIGVLTREGASSRKNGIVFLDTSDLAHPKVISEYTATVTGGVHSAFIDGHYVYLTDDATGSLRVIDFKDVKAPKEVARWQVENPAARTVEGPAGPISAGRYLHDVQVKDGLAYLAYWRDGVVILDVGNGIKGGKPEQPQLVSQLRFNYHELYGAGWLAGAHAVFRYQNYLFVGDEVFPAEFNIYDKARIPVRGIVHVVDVSDLAHPRKVAEYNVPEAGAHNIWVKDDVLYMGYYNGGGRVLDVSGELRGDLYRQGREIGRLWTGDPEGFRPNLPFTWGAQPHSDGRIFFVDINTGLWIVKLGKLKDKGSTTAPGY